MRAGRDLSMEGYSPEQVADFQARATGEYANALRVVHQSVEAEAWLAKAFQHASQGTGDPWLYARLLDLLGSLYVSLYRYPEAIKVFEETFRRYGNLEDQHHAGRALIKMGMASGLAGQVPEALALLARGVSLIDKSRDPELEKIALHNQLNVLVDSCQFESAIALLLAHREELAGVSGGKLHGIEGRIYAGLGHPDLAEDAFRLGKTQLLATGDPAHAGILILDLAALLLAQGRTAEGRAEAEEALAIYKALEIEPEARKAFVLLAEALRLDLVTAPFLDSVVTFLRRLEHQPWLRFIPAFS
jgi:tetratricopeptide (TPR) repeat protein